MIRALRPFCMALLLWLAGPETGRPAGDDLALPDKVVLKEGAALPYFTTQREIDCVILEETGGKIVLNTSRKKGVEERHEIARTDVEKVVRGDASARAFDLIRLRLALPP